MTFDTTWLLSLNSVSFTNKQTITFQISPAGSVKAKRCLYRLCWLGCAYANESKRIVGRCKFIVDKNKLIAGLQHFAFRNFWRRNCVPFEQINIYVYTFRHIQCWYVFIYIHINSPVHINSPDTMLICVYICEDCFYYCLERNNVVVLFGTLKV